MSCVLAGGGVMGRGVQEVLVADLIDREGGQSLIVSDDAGVRWSVIGPRHFWLTVFLIIFFLRCKVR